MKLLLKIMYNGAGYAGWQAQNDEALPKPSLQRVLTASFSACFGFPVKITGCSRTDAGVHALGFCAAVEPAGEHDPDEWLRIPVGKVHRAANRFLPEDVSVCGEVSVPDDFHPHYSAVGKTYVYRMTDTLWRDPFEEGRAWHLPRPLPPDGVERMQRAASWLCGTRDFTSFMAAGSKITDARRTVYALNLSRTGHEIVLTAEADGFLYHMVRIIAGTLADCARGAIDPDDLPAILEAKDRSRAGRTAPAHGLFLSRVDYGFPIDWRCE